VKTQKALNSSIFNEKIFQRKDQKEISKDLANEIFLFFKGFEKRKFSVSDNFISKKLFYSEKLKGIIFMVLDGMHDGTMREIPRIVFAFDIQKIELYRFRSFPFEGKKFLKDSEIACDDIKSINEILKSRKKIFTFEKDFIKDIVELFLKASLDFSLELMEIDSIYSRKSKKIFQFKTKEKGNEGEVISWEIKFKKYKIVSIRKI